MGVIVGDGVRVVVNNAINGMVLMIRGIKIPVGIGAFVRVEVGRRVFVGVEAIVIVNDGVGI